MNRMNIALACLLVLVVVACGTTSAYKTIATIETSVDKGMIGWADWVKLKRSEGADMTTQTAQVKASYTLYRSAVNSYYELRLTGNAEAQYAAVQKAALSLLNLINTFLPPAKAVSTKGLK